MDSTRLLQNHEVCAGVLYSESILGEENMPIFMRSVAIALEQIEVVDASIDEQEEVQIALAVMTGAATAMLEMRAGEGGREGARI